MILSRPDILEYLESGRLKIDPPLGTKSVAQVSIDLRLGGKFTVFKDPPQYLPAIHVDPSLWGSADLWQHYEQDEFRLNDVESFLEENWPFGEPVPTIYSDPRAAEPESRFSLHAKCIVVDEAKALVTSANFTDRGQTRNIEMGVLVDDPGLATRLVHQWRA